MNTTVSDIIKRALDLPKDYQPDPHQDLRDDLGADSIAIMGIFVEIEAAFEVEFTPAVLVRARTVGGLISEIEKASSVRSEERR